MAPLVHDLDEPLLRGSKRASTVRVEGMVAAGRLEELAAYCDTDIFVGYLLFLRFSLVTGGINLDCYCSSLEQLRQHMTDRLSSHRLKKYVGSA